MKQSARERLSTLNRRYREITIESQDKERTETVYYRRPTEAEDNILQQAMREEGEDIRASLKNAEEGKESVFQTLVKFFEEDNIDYSLNTIVEDRLPSIRRNAMSDAGLKFLDDDATEEEQQQWREKFSPEFERLLNEAKDEYRSYDRAVLAVKAAEVRVSKLAQERAVEIYRRRLIAQSLYDKLEDGSYELIYDKPEEVPEYLDKETIDLLANKIIEEINRFKNVPLK